MQAVDRLHGRGRILKGRIRKRTLRDINEKTDSICDVLVERRLELQDQRLV